ncbi:hypothetical protein SEVIR_6G061900v4 [Setaria viridis]|uniref:DUF4220 domain-containing protein n=1 Tax=Setaria viridis TaxID=4556 RepID=A0A4U6U0P5_SETVI|nr:uncharacterized protein LOC117860295 [Setaria viridis]TKW08988.1 hypothetical protein SEVIR_6G061900v2 [Setaria viridis]
MGLSSAVQWWEEWQLRILVLGSLAIQCYLAFFASARKKHIRPLFRFSIWLAYLGGDAIAIYALATLFNRQRKVWYTSEDGSHELEVLWAPILLMHLGGQINISAYNIEDNELWRRHVVTAVSQVAVALYVFCKSWSPSADRRLLAAAILLFILGVFKCSERPLVLKRNCFNSLVSSFHPSPRAKNINREVELEVYIQEARDFVDRNKQPPTMDSDAKLPHLEQLSIPDKLLVDSAYAYTDRLNKLKSLWSLDYEAVYAALRNGLSITFDLIYSKEPQYTDPTREENLDTDICSIFLFFSVITLPIVPIILFHISHKQAYRRSDIRVTFSLLYTTYLLEISSYVTTIISYSEWHDVVPQNSLTGFLARKRRNTWLMGVAESKPCYSSEDITGLVQVHVRNGWINYINDTESYWKFSDIRGHWTLERNGCEANLGGSIEKPFDESIILWHVATDFCFHHKGASPDSRPARLCREISNYMVHLLFANPEMLIPGSRTTLFTDAYNELEALLKDDDLTLLDEKQVTEKIIEKMGSSEEGDIVHDSWVLAQKLMELGEEKMWEVIEGVWIEMLCFSAARCRGYLHTKSLGTGGEYLTFVSLLMSHAGLETFAERQQRIQLRLPKEERVKIAKKRIQEATSNQAVKEENAATPPATEANGQVRQEEKPAAASASQGECVAPAIAHEFEIVVSP